MIEYVWSVWSNIAGVVLLIGAAVEIGIRAWGAVTDRRERRRRELRSNVRVVNFPPRVAK